MGTRHGTVRTRKLLAVLTAAVLTLASGTIQAYTALCQPPANVTQDACCPSDSKGMQTGKCTMDGCDCAVSEAPKQPEQPQAVLADKGFSVDVPITASCDVPSDFESIEVARVEPCLHQDRGPPDGPELSGHGLRAPPACRA